MTKKICYIGMLTALYVVFSAFFKVNLIGNIMLDFGYIVFAIALCQFGPLGAGVGIAGCALESVLFSAYGFSFSWTVANTIIGVGCGICFVRVKRNVFRILIMVAFSALGLLFAKTIIECNLYNIPLSVKLPKNSVAFAADSLMMGIGILINQRINKAIRSEE